MAYTIEEANIEAQKILDSVKRNTDTITIDSLIRWFKDNCHSQTITEPAWDEHDTGSTYSVWSIDKNPYGKKDRSTIDNIIDEIIELNKKNKL